MYKITSINYKAIKTILSKLPSTLLLLYKYKRQEDKKRDKEERKEKERNEGRDGDRQERKHKTPDHTVLRTQTYGCNILNLTVGVLFKTDH